jgi:hypothetical protein
VTVKTSGFQTEVQKGVVLTVGATVVLDFHLKLASQTEVMEVAAQPPVVETQRGSQANTVIQQYISDLPIDRRDYLTFALLLPGASNSTRLADDQDYRVKQTPQSGLSFYGSNGRGNSVTVDGGEANDDAGGVRLTVSQAAVQEFQVNRSNYSAELGGASGASINIVTKSGGNEVHGSLFGFFRNSALDARDPFAFTQALQPGETFNPANPDMQGKPVKNSLSRQQIGGSVGFPIRRDKTFLFLAFEALRQNAQTAVPLLTNTSIFRPDSTQSALLDALKQQGNGTTVPCLSGPIGAAVASQLGLPASSPVTNLPAATCAATLNGVLTLNPAVSPLSAFLVNQFETNGGLFNYDTREYLASGRLDHSFNSANQFSLVYRFGHDREENADVHSLTGSSAGSSIHNYDNNIQAAWFRVFGPATQNELLLQWDYNSFNVIPNTPAEVGLQIPGFANNLGTNLFLPNFTILRRYELADNVTLVRGHHIMRFGGSELIRGNHSESHTLFPGRFVFGSLPGELLSPQIASINSLQATSFGVPQIYQQGFGNANYPASARPFTGVYAQDSWNVVPNFTLNYGIRYELDTQYLPLNNYHRDFAPRLSFAWDPFKDHKTVVRGGYGIFYSPIYTQIPQVDLSLGVLNKDRSTVENQNNPQQIPNQVENLVDTCGIAFPPGTPVVPFVGTAASPCTRFISVYVDPLSATPFSPFLQTSAQVFQGLFAQGLIQCTTPTPGAAACITPADVARFGIFATNSGPVSPLTVVFSNPPDYKPPYAQQAAFGIEREIAPDLSIAASFIYSHTLRLPVAIDTNVLPAPYSTVKLVNGQVVSYRNWNGDTPGNPAPSDPLGGREFPGGLSPCANAFACFVNPLITQNNQYTAAASALYEGGILEIKKTFSRHFAAFISYTYSKGFDTTTDFNSDYGPQDPTNLGLDRGLSEFDQRHSVVAAGVLQSPWGGKILSGFQLSPIFTYHSGHPFNLLAGGEVNGDNHTTNERPIGAPRDSGLGPNYADFDGRLSWQYKFGERAALQLTAEAFNLFNRTNYASLNNVVGPLFGLTPDSRHFTCMAARRFCPASRWGSPLISRSARSSSACSSCSDAASRTPRLRATP